MSSEGFSALDENAGICSQRAILPTQLGVTATVTAFLATFLKFEIAGVWCGSPLLTTMDVWCTSNIKKSAPNAHFFCSMAVTPSLRPDFQANI